MPITSHQIQDLRLKTGAGIMDCKKALEEAKGNPNSAQKILVKKGALKAQKKSDRVACQGVVESYIHAGGKIGVLVELNCETDFVARNSEFKNLAHDLAMQIASMNPKDTKEFLSEEFIKDPSLTIKDLLNQTVVKIGENIQIKRFIRYELGE